MSTERFLVITLLEQRYRTDFPIEAVTDAGEQFFFSRLVT